MAKASKHDTSKSTSTSKTPKSATTGKAKPRETKRTRLIGLLTSAKGADVALISKKLGWQPHTTRAALTGLRKAGFAIERSADEGDGTSTYRITAEPAAAPAE